MHDGDGDGVGDDPQQPVLPLALLHLVAVLVQVVQQQRGHRLPQLHQLAAREPSKWPRFLEKRRMWPALWWVGSTEASTRHLASRVTGLVAALVTWLVESTV